MRTIDMSMICSNIFFAAAIVVQNDSTRFYTCIAIAITNILLGLIALFIDGLVLAKMTNSAKDYKIKNPNKKEEQEEK